MYSYESNQSGADPGGGLGGCNLLFSKELRRLEAAWIMLSLRAVLLCTALQETKRHSSS